MSLQPFYKKIFLVLILILLTGCREDKASTIFDKAEELWRYGRYKEAIERYENVATVYPQSELSPRAIYNIGIIQMLYLLNNDMAIGTFKRLFLEFPDSKEVRLARRHVADIYMNKTEDYKRAIFEYQQLIDDSLIDDFDVAQLNIAVAYLKLEDFIQARIEFEDLIERYPSSPLIPEASYRIAGSFLLEGRKEEAVEWYKKVVEVYPGSPFYIESRFGIAMVREETGDLKGALSLYRELEGEYPNPSVIKVRIERLQDRVKH